MAYKQKNLMRAVWIANKAKDLCDCYQTKLCLADCLLNLGIFGIAIEEYTSLLIEEPGNVKVKKDLKIAKKILERLA